jgi:protocatechuate 3,4-dioxygenase beta subunit
VSANRAAERTAALALLLAGIAAAQTVSGTVADGTTHEPLAGVSVQFLNTRASGSHAAKTDSAGAFRVAMPPGDYTVVTIQPGFEVPDVGTLRVHVEDGRDPAALEILLLRHPKLSGRVLDPERRPVAGIPVTVIPFRGVNLAPAVTDKSGRFQFDAVSSGEYALLANPLEAGVREFSPTYFPNSGDRWGGERIVAKAGADLSGYDIVLRGGPFFKVNGRVLDDGGRPAAGTTVTITAGDVVYGSAKTGSEGVFGIEHVPAVDGQIRAEWKRGSVELRGFGPVAVARHDVENIVLRLSPPVQVSGTVELDGETTSPSSGFFVNLAPVQGSGKHVTGITSDSGFRFDDAYPGRYVLFAIPPGGPRAYEEGALLGDRDITMQEFEVTPGMLPLRVILRTGGGSVTATVEDPNSTGAVVLVPQEPRLRCQPFLVQASARRAGTWSFANVRPGDYYALAISGRLRLTDFSDPAYFAPLLSKAEAVHVERGGTASVTLKWAQLP